MLSHIGRNMSQHVVTQIYPAYPNACSRFILQNATASPSTCHSWWSKSDIFWISQTLTLNWSSESIHVNPNLLSILKSPHVCWSIERPVLASSSSASWSVFAALHSTWGLFTRGCWRFLHPKRRENMQVSKVIGVPPVIIHFRLGVSLN